MRKFAQRFTSQLASASTSSRQSFKPAFRRPEGWSPLNEQRKADILKWMEEKDKMIERMRREHTAKNRYTELVNAYIDNKEISHTGTSSSPER